MKKLHDKKTLDKKGPDKKDFDEEIDGFIGLTRFSHWKNDGDIIAIDRNKKYLEFYMQRIHTKANCFRCSCVPQFFSVLINGKSSKKDFSGFNIPTVLAAA